MEIKNNIKKVIAAIFILFMITAIGISLLYPESNNYNNYDNYLALNEDDVVYLSDMEFRKSQTAWGSIFRDKTSSNTSFSLKLEGNQVIFKKGIWAHATSTIEFDLTNYKDYTYFVTYYGVNETSRNNGNGVKFYVYTSVDGINWNLKTDSNPSALKSGNEAGYIKVDITDANYLKLYANDNGHNGNDHSIWADAKLVKKDYKENAVKTVEEYDAEIKKAYNGEITEDLELLILQRDLVKNAGQFTFKTFLEEEWKVEEHTETLNFLMNNLDILKMYVMGGKPNGSYIKSFQVLNNLYHTYKNDLTVDGVTSGGHKLSLIYQKMIISLSLSHSDNVSFWINSTKGEDVDENPNISIPERRYEILKNMLLNNQLDPLFEDLEVEEMRYIMYSFINDDEIEWLNSLAKTKSNRYSAYSYINYKNVNTALYRSPKYYGEGRLNYEEKYMLKNSYVKNVAYYPRLWIIMDVGGVCWQLSNIGQNVLTSLGIPATIVGQPGHTAYIVYGKDNLGRSTWALWNDVGGWTKTNTSGYTGTRSYYQVRLLNSWGNGTYASSNNGSYVLLAQSALDDYENYVASSMLVKLANTYTNNSNKLEEIYRQALTKQSVNFDAWLSLVNLYLNSNKTEEEYYNLAREVASTLENYPLPMHDLLRLIKTKVNSTDVLVRLNLLETRTLTNASKVTEKDAAQSDVVRKMANYLLGIIDTKVADFSFDGDNANVLKLSSMYDSSHASWEYSLDKGTTWTLVTDGHSKKLSKDEISKITENNDILVHIIGTNREPENIYTIDITKASINTSLYGNDLENRVIGATNKEEWKYVGSDTWTSFDTLPDLKGNKNVLVRTKATGTALASDSKSFSFSEDSYDSKKVYVPLMHFTVSEFSSETDRVGNREYARNAIDGNLYTMWHTNRKVVETNKYIVLKLDVPMYISALEYIPYQNYKYGVMKDAIISVSMDGSTWTEVAKMNNRANNTNPTMINFDKVLETKYVKLYIESHDKKFANAAMINLYHDSTKEEIPTANIELSTYEPTSGDVIATLIYDENELTITNNDGENTYKFTENGSFTFEFVNSKGVSGEATAVVSNIDKTIPTLNVTYDNLKITKDPVVAKLEFSEPVIILNEDLTLDVHTDENCYTYTFFKNEEHLIKFRDKAGNENSKIIKVDWIDTEVPMGDISYNISSFTTKEVVATLKTNEKVTILNNNGKNTYTFKENGEFVFQFKDSAGNVGSVTALVNWIVDSPVVNIKYSETNKTNMPVVATLDTLDKIIITNNDGKDTYTFTENGEFTFTYKDIYDNQYEIVAKVDWIEKENQEDINKPVENDEKVDTPSVTKPNNSTNKKPSNNDKTESKYKTYSTNGIKLEVPSKLYKKDVALIKSKLPFNAKFLNEVGDFSEYFDLYLESKDGKKLNISNSTYKLTFTLDTEKEFKGIYEVDNNNLVKLDYEKLDNNEISIKTKKLGKFVISYDVKEKVDKDQNSTKDEKKLSIIKVVLGISLVVLAALIGVILKNKNVKKNRSK